MYLKTLNTHEEFDIVKHSVVAENVYYVTGNEDAIKTELYLHGPVEATMALYEGFFQYKSGRTHFDQVLIYVIHYGSRTRNDVPDGVSKNVNLGIVGLNSIRVTTLRSPQLMLQVYVRGLVQRFCHTS